MIFIFLHYFLGLDRPWFKVKLKLWSEVKSLSQVYRSAFTKGGYVNPTWSNSKLDHGLTMDLPRLWFNRSNQTKHVHNKICHNDVHYLHVCMYKFETEYFEV